MAVIDTTGGLQQTVQNFAILGQALGEIFKSDEERLLEFIQQNPQLSAGIARAGHVAEAEGTPLPGANIGMGPEAVQTLMRLLPPSLQEQIQFRLMGDEDFVGLAATGAEEGARTEIATARTERATAEQELDILTRLKNSDFAGIAASARLGEVQLQGEQQRAFLESLAAREKFILSLPEAQRTRFAAVMSDPAAFADLRAQRQLDLRERLAQAAGSRLSLKDELQMRIDINQELDRLIGQARETIEAGDESEVLPSIIGRINDLAKTQAALFPGDVVTTARGVEAIFGKDLKDIGLDAITVRELQIGAAVGLIESGQATLAQLVANEEVPLEFKQEINRRLEQRRSSGDEQAARAGARLSLAGALFGAQSREEILAQIASLERQLREIPATAENNTQRAQIRSRLMALSVAEFFTQPVPEGVIPQTPGGPRR